MGSSVSFIALAVRWEPSFNSVRLVRTLIGPNPKYLSENSSAFRAAALSAISGKNRKMSMSLKPTPSKPRRLIFKAAQRRSRGKK
jgi:hypothetical protein